MKVRVELGKCMLYHPLYKWHTVFIKKHRAGTKRNGVVELVRLIQLSTVGEVFLEGTCPLSRCPQTAKFPAPSLLGARRRWVRKATAFRGRSEQDRSALFAACSTMILKTFRWNVFSGISLCRNRRTRRAVSAIKIKLRACVHRKYMRIFEQIFLQTRQKFAGILSYGKNF